MNSLEVARNDLAPAARLRSGLRSGADFVAHSQHVTPIVISLAISALVTLCLMAIGPLLELEHAAFGYLIPVIIAATRWGVVPAMISLAVGVAASAFFFYPPLFDFRVEHPAHVADLVLFIVVAITTAYLANTVRKHERIALKRSEEIKALYFFSRRLATAAGPADIYSAIQDHMSTITGRKVFFFAYAQPLRPEALPQLNAVPRVVQRTVSHMLEGGEAPNPAPVIEEASNASWLLRTLSQRASMLGVLAIELGPLGGEALDEVSRRMKTALAEAAATLERIDVVHAIGEAKIRSETDSLREAVIGSVSHELRTPLASILGAASILADAPELADNGRLSSLAGLVREQAERLNEEIRDLLDASRISSAGLRPQPEWTDPADIIDAAIEGERHRSNEQRIDRELSADLPMVYVDPVLIGQALGQVIDNAIKYSPPGSRVAIVAKRPNGRVTIAVADQGCGLTAEERDHIWQRFYRGARQASVPGQGLGLWIAQAFVTACGAELVATSEGIGRGSTFSLILPSNQAAPGQPEDIADD